MTESNANPESQIKAFLIKFERNYNFTIKETSSEFNFSALPSDDLFFPTDKNGFYMKNLKYVSCCIYKYFKNFQYLLFIDKSQLYKDNEKSKFPLNSLEDSMKIALLVCLMSNNFFDESIFSSFFEYFLTTNKSYLWEKLYNIINKEVLKQNEEEDSKQNGKVIELNYYTLFFCFFKNEFEFYQNIKSGKVKALIPEDLATLQNLLKFQNAFNNFPDRFRNALIYTIFIYKVCNDTKDFSFSPNSLNKLTENKKNIEHHDNKNYDEQMFNNFFTILETRPTNIIWSESIKILKNVLPNKYWNYFVNDYIFKSVNFVLNVDLLAKVIIDHNLINKLILKHPILFDNIFTKIVNDKNFNPKIGFNTFQNYFNLYGISSFSKLLVDESGFTNRLKYFDVFVCLLKFAQMTIIDLIENANKTENETENKTINVNVIKTLSIFCEKHGKEKFFQYFSDSNSEEVQVKQQFQKVFKEIFKPVLKNFKEKMVYIITDPLENKISDNCIFKQIERIVDCEYFKKLMTECFNMRNDWKILNNRSKTIKKYFENHKDDLPPEISFEEMKNESE